VPEARGTRPPSQKIGRYGHVVVSFVLVGLGVYILLESGSLSLFVWGGIAG
jgi:cadmium resistance protein CadD (predicted permease)